MSPAMYLFSQHQKVLESRAKQTLKNQSLIPDPNLFTARGFQS